MRKQHDTRLSMALAAVATCAELSCGARTSSPATGAVDDASSDVSVPMVDGDSIVSEEDSASESGPPAEGGCPAADVPRFDVAAPEPTDASITQIDGSTVVTIASARNHPHAIATDGENVYWYDMGSSTSRFGKTSGSWVQGQILKCDVHGCENRPTVLASNLVTTFSSFNGMVVSHGNVYWGGEGPGSRVLFRCGVSGCECGPELLASAYVFEVAVGPTDIFFTTRDDQKVLSCPFAGCGKAPRVLWVGPPPSPRWGTLGVAVDAKDVYWSTIYGQIMKCAVEGCGGEMPTVVVSGISGLGNIALDADNVYYTDSDLVTHGRIMKCAKAGCGNQPTALVTGLIDI